MRIGSKLISLIVLLLVISTACGSNGSDESGGEKVNVDGPALVMFYTDNWAPWLVIMPIVDGLSEEFDGRVSVIQLNAALSTNARLQADFGLTGHPSFVVLDNEGRVKQRFFGPQTEMTLRQSMEAIASQ